MRIAYLVNRYPAVSHSFIRREILGLEALGHDVVRFSIRPVPGDLPDPADLRERERTRIVLDQGAGALIGTSLAMVFRRPGRFFKALRAAFAMAGYGLKPKLRHLAYLVEAAWLAKQMQGIDHLHAHFGTNPAAVARLVHILSGVPYSFTVHGPEEFDFPLGYALGQKIADAKFTVAISSFGRSQLMRWAAYRDWPKLQVVRCGVDEAFADAAVAPPQPAATLCCVARLSGQKGLPLLIEAAQLLRDRGVSFHLTLVGDGEMRSEIEAMIDRAGLGMMVTITGYLSAAGVREKIQTSRAMVLPSFAEGLPVVIMEALALGVPVLTTAIAGIPELVDAECGWIVPAGSVEALADAMATVLAEDPVRLRAMGEVGRARVLAMHDARANAAALAELIAR
ncbi:glycosyltransferase involved in cell wall biosynthesis [Sphingomonas vulcanisoli]|uniref:Glycosyltransferase involved in cell wall biosynthesis n=1 Tax=Sphingomonas vulcanisoli TaxID=1658060 RepID=A0ABX0TX05_9SPHN|nr:glycosyltransferase family 4 protein [Sphingomonas vulcanisoli]NIJ08925.1 glycosyltransferase involved in cell wall biosynthesis [Sphingomonas vulcanisoli]